MEYQFELIMFFLPWLIFSVFGFIVVMSSKVLLSWAKHRKTGAIIFGALVQMFTPDPYVQRTIETMVIEQKIVKKHYNENGQPEE